MEVAIYCKECLCHRLKGDGNPDDFLLPGLACFI